MALMIATAKTVPAGAKITAVGVLEGALPDYVDADLMKAKGYTGKAGQYQTVNGPNGLVAMVGMGKAEDLTVDIVRETGAKISRSAKKHSHVATTIVEELPEGIDQVAAAQAFAEGLVMGSYTYTAQKSSPEKVELKKITVVSAVAKVSKAIALGAAVAEGVALARDLVNEPGGSLTPPKFAAQVQRMARKVGLKVKVLDKAAIEKAKLGGLLGVNQGSTHPARFVELTYEPEVKAKGTIAFVGKGITFDAGGLSIKTGNGMMTMKCDMGGAAAVVGAMSVLPASKPPVRVRAYLPMTDNMLGGDAIRPGDVVTLRNGKTMEILNTDAEGRIVLADALSLASEAKPDAIVDLATLTGACMAALGPKIAGRMGNNDNWISQVGEAAENSGERTWELPLPADYRTMVDSSVADMKNIGGPYGGALTAGLILEEFVGEGIPWVHLDIAGPAFSDSADKLHPKGGTGFGVRTLVRLAQDFAKIPAK